MGCCGPFFDYSISAANFNPKNIAYPLQFRSSAVLPDIALKARYSLIESTGNGVSFYKRLYPQRRCRYSGKDHSRCVTVPGSYEIETPIRPPSDFTLILNNCHLRMADGAGTLPENNASVDITPFWKP